MKNKLTFLALITLFNFSVIFAQAPITPANTLTGVSQATANVTWTDFDDGNGNGPYDVEFDNDPLFGSLDASASNTVATSLALPALSYNTTYYWRVRDTDIDGIGGDGSWHSYSFTTLLATPSLTGPANAATGQSITPSLSWTLAASTSNVQYYIDYDDDGELVIDKTTVGPYASSPQSLPALSYNTTYTWQVRAEVTAGPPNAGETTTSSTRTFTTISAAPTLISPANNSLGVSLTPTLTWNSAAGANLYQVTMTGSGAPAPFTTASTNVVLAPLTAGVVYTWYVESSNNGGTNWSTPSTTWTFTTNYLVSPANLSVGISIVPTFNWLAVGGAGSYTLEIATDSGFSGIVLTQAGLVSPTYTLTQALALSNGVTYYWRVTSNNGVVSGTWLFISVLPAVPYLTNPSNATTLSGTTIYFGWYTSGIGVVFDLQVDDASDFLTPLQAFSNLASTTYNWIYTGLTPGSSYYWRVIAKTNSGVIVNYSSVWSFVVPGMPTVYASYPTGGVTVYTTTPTLYWYTGTYYNGQYQVQYRTSAGAYPGSPQVTTSNLFTTLPVLTSGTYFWQVRSYNGVQLGSWSTETSFVISNPYAPTPVVPYPSYPTGGVTVYTNPPTFYYYTGTYSTGLQFEVSYATNNTFTTGLVTLPLTSDLYATPPSSLTAGTPYYWRVRSTDGFTFSGYSSTANFVMNSSSSSVPTPYPSYPTGGVTIFVLNPTLSWAAYSPSALQFQVNYSAFPNTNGSGELNLANTLSSWTASTSYALSGLTPGVTYYWQVKSRLAATPASESSWSTISTFSTSAGAFAVVPLIGSPNFGQPINQSSAVLSWILPTQSSSQLAYQLQYSKNSEMNDAVTLSNIPKNFQQISGLEQNKTYYWRVLSKTNNGSVSSYSSTGSFKTSGATAVEDKEVIPTQFELSQNYPNPFNPTTRIAYSLPQNSYVSIKVYDMLGREVRSLVNNEMLAGNHSIEWSGVDNAGNKVASGTYIYRITAGNFVAVKKMILIK